MYEKWASSTFPILLWLLLDDSGSMKDALLGGTDPKWAYVERYLAHILKDLVARCTELKGTTVSIKARYFLQTLLYGSTPKEWGSGVMDVQATLEKFTRDGNSFGLGGNLGGTDSLTAFEKILEALRQLVADERFRSSFPPVVFHLTDGESQSDASAVAAEIKKLATADGNVLIVNAYIGTQTNLNYQGPEDFIGYTDVAEVGSSPDNIRLFNMSSVMPECIRTNLAGEGIFPQIRPGSRLFFDVRTREMLKNVIQVVSSIPSQVNR